MSAAVNIVHPSPWAEDAVIGALLLGASFEEVAAIVKSEDFTVPALRLIFTAIADLPSGTADVLTLEQRLKERGQLDAAGGVARLSELVRNTPSAKNVCAYAEALRRDSVVRRVQKLLGEDL